MVIEKVHGLHATQLTLNERFSLLAHMPITRATRPRMNSVSNTIGYKNIRHHNLIEQIAQHLELQAKRQAVKQRLGARRFGSENNLPGLKRTNSFSNLSQRSVRTRIPWRNKGNVKLDTFNNVFQGGWRNWGYKRRGGRMGLTRGRMRGRGGHQPMGRMRPRRGAIQQPAGGRGTRGRGRGRGGPRGGAEPNKPIPTKEELDLQLDQYMASTKTALDKELDSYMRNAMELD